MSMNNGSWAPGERLRLQGASFKNQSLFCVIPVKTGIQDFQDAGCKLPLDSGFRRSDDLPGE